MQLKRLFISILALSVLPCTLAWSQSVTATFSYSGNPLYVFPASANIATVATIQVPRALTVSNVTARVRISYPQVGDLNVFLYSADGTRTILLEHNCGTLQNIDTTFADAATTKYSDFCPAEAGRGPFQGNEPLANSNGQSSFGIWSLGVQNNSSDSRSGWIQEFSITITGTEQYVPSLFPNGVLNSSSLQARPIAPASVVTLVGTALGPLPGMEAPSGYWPTWMDGTVARINGQDAPMRFISGFRIEVQVPTGLDLTKPADVYVSRQGVETNHLSVSVAAASPGVMTTNRTGIGPALAWNADGSRNAISSPATLGTKVRLLATGLGNTTPVTSEGQPIPQGAAVNVNLPTFVMIGGQMVQATAIGAPGMTGDYYVDFTVPASLSPGSWELWVNCGNYLSQDNVFIFVK